MEADPAFDDHHLFKLVLKAMRVRGEIDLSPTLPFARVQKKERNRGVVMCIWRIVEFVSFSDIIFGSILQNF
jgi:hypothetical protein